MIGNQIDCVPGRHFAMFGTFFLVTTWGGGMLLAQGWWRPEMLLNALQSPGRPHQSHPALDAYGTHVEKP